MAQTPRPGPTPKFGAGGYGNPGRLVKKTADVVTNMERRLAGKMADKVTTQPVDDSPMGVPGGEKMRKMKKLKGPKAGKFARRPW